MMIHRPAKVLLVEEIPKLDSDKTVFSVTKKIALVNNKE